MKGFYIPQQLHLTRFYCATFHSLQVNCRFLNSSEWKNCFCPSESRTRETANSTDNVSETTASIRQSSNGLFRLETPRTDLFSTVQRHEFENDPGNSNNINLEVQDNDISFNPSDPEPPTYDEAVLEAEEDCPPSHAATVETTV